jgi:hypothetical protein
MQISQRSRQYTSTRRKRPHQFRRICHLRPGPSSSEHNHLSKNEKSLQAHPNYFTSSKKFDEEHKLEATAVTHADDLNASLYVVKTGLVSPRTVAMYAAAPHHGGRNDKLKILITVIIRQHSPPRPDTDVGDCDGPLVRVVNAREPAELIWPLVF